MRFLELLNRLRGTDWKPPKSLYVIDPGETTGVAVFIDGVLTNTSQIDTSSPCVFDSLIDDMISYNPDIVLCEEYRVYANKTEQHSWSKIHTVRIIGAVEYICHREGIRIFKQLAATAKGFCTDDKLKEWGMYLKGKHARDAIRHGCYLLLFNKEVK